MLGQPEERNADECRHDGSGEAGGDNIGKKRPSSLGGEDRGSVGTNAEEGRVGQRQTADVTHHQIVGQRQRREQRRKDEDVQDITLLARHRRSDEPWCSDDDNAGDEPDRSPHGQIPIRRPNRPCGRQRSTAIMIRNAIASL